MTTASHDPWAEQDLLDAAIEKGAVFIHPGTGWKFRVRHFQPWSPYLRRAATLVGSRPEVAVVFRKGAAGEKLTPAEEAVRDNANLEIGIRSSVMSWAGVTGRDKKPLKMEIASALEVFGTLKRVWAAVSEFSVDPANYGLDKPVSATVVPEGVNAQGNSSGTSDTAPEDSDAS